MSATSTTQVCDKCGSVIGVPFKPDFEGLKPNVLIIKEIIEAGLSKTRMLAQNINEEYLEKFLVDMQPWMQKLNQEFQELYIANSFQKKIIPLDIAKMKEKLDETKV